MSIFKGRAARAMLQKFDKPQSISSVSEATNAVDSRPQRLPQTNTAEAMVLRGNKQTQLDQLVLRGNKQTQLDQLVLRGSTQFGCLIEGDASL